ncbi:hypothetical protein [Ectobacillus panaciterrae]|uniref:hypothetical protein n=1 Tax=Ectobacillus panaciterrae TaxID=363872 RepID=UPI00041396FF|nr:hypothetical protein [Ectobacillus panaciterrae]
MKTWAYIKNSELIAGITEEGLPFFENKVQGWNDNKRDSDIEDLIIHRAVVYDEGAELRIKSIYTYTSEDVMNNPIVMQKYEEAEQILLREINLWLNGAN